MAWYDIDIYVGRPSSVWDAALGTLAPGSLQSWSYDYGADTQRGTHPPRPPTFSFSILLTSGADEPEWLEGDRCIARFSYPGQAAFTYFVGSLEQPTFDRLTGRTVVRCRAYGLLANLPGDVSLEVHEDDNTGTLFSALLEAAGVPLASRRADSTMDRELERYLASETDLVKELQRIADTQGPPALWYQTWDGAILAHARGMLTDALTIGGQSDHRARGRVSREHDLRNIVNSVRVDETTVNVSQSTSSTSVRSDTASVTIGPLGGRENIIAGIDIDDIDYDYLTFEGSGDFIETARYATPPFASIRGYVEGAGSSGFCAVRARRYNVSTETTTTVRSLIEEDSESIAHFGVRRLGRDVFGGLSDSDIRDLARAFLRQYAFGLTQRSFDLRITPDNIAAILGDGSDFSGLYVGRPIVIVQDGEAALGRISRVAIGASSPVLVARIETDSYVSGELLFVPSSFTRNVGTGDAYSITIPAVIGGVAPYTYALQSGPGHASFNAATRVVSGTAPNSSATQGVVIRATDSSPPTLTGDLSEIGNVTSFPAFAAGGGGLAGLNDTLYLGIVENLTPDTFYFYSVDTASAAVTQIGPPFPIGSRSYDSAGMAELGGAIYVGLIDDTGDDFYLYTVDTTNGELTFQGSHLNFGARQWNAAGMTSLDGVLYLGAIDDADDEFHLFAVDTDNGALSLVAEHISVGTGVWDTGGMMTFGGRVYLGLFDQSGGSHDYYLWRVNTETGTLNQAGNEAPIADFGFATGGMAELGGNAYLAAASQGDDVFYLYEFDQIGQLTADFTLTLEISQGQTPPPPQLARPTGLSLTEAGGDITANWNDVGNATRYVLEWREQGSGDAWQTAVVSSPPHTFTP